MIGIYIHIPFCTRKCRYCDFPSYAGADRYKAPYVQALCREIDAYTGDTKADTVYIGGGTPSLLAPAQIGAILSHVRRRMALTDDAEITVEANPDSMSRAYAAALFQAGVNRVSLGVQSFDDAVLSSLGRIHTARQGRQAVWDVRHSGIANISIDLMYGLPGQTLASVRQDLDEVAQLPVSHASMYSLIVEEHTVLEQALREKTTALPPADETDAMGQYIRGRMKDLGFSQYEISSYARRGYESRHNSKYWQYVPYVGFGVSAHSFDGAVRWANIANIPAYIQKAGRDDVRKEIVPISRRRAAEDYCFLALRMRRGIQRGDFKARFSSSVEAEFGPVLTRLLALKLLEETPSAYRLTALGRDYGNYVFSQFIREP